MRNRLLHTVYIALLVALTLVHLPLTFAQEQPARDPAIEAEANVLFSTIMSPFCPGRLLRDCPSGQAGELKDKIRADLSKGLTRDQIADSIYRTYGEEMRAAPSNSGFGRVAWLAPFGFLILGLFGAIVWLKRSWVTASPTDTLTSSAIDPNLQRRIEEELK